MFGTPLLSCLLLSLLLSRSQLPAPQLFLLPSGQFSSSQTLGFFSLAALGLNDLLPAEFFLLSLPLLGFRLVTQVFQSAVFRLPGMFLLPELLIDGRKGHKAAGKQ